MKNKILTVLTVMLMAFSVFSCGPTVKVKHNGDGTVTVAGTQSMYRITHEYTQYQLDSMCVADNLPEDLTKWLSSSYRDYETNVPVVRYMYIKEMNDSYELVYVVTQKGDIYVVSKRKVVSE